MTRVLRNLLLLAVLGTLAVPATASADPVSDCSGDGDLDRSYTNRQLKDALDNIPGELDEYSNCRDVIGSAITRGSDNRNNDDGGNSGGGGDSGGGGGSGSISAEEQGARQQDNADLEAIAGDSNDSPSVRVGGEEVEPGSNGLFDLASASNDLPVPLLVALVAIGVLAILGGGLALRDRVPALARIPLLSKLPRVSLPRFRR